jgi:hypothetical protein
MIASLADGEAVLRFPYDERLRQLLRAIPGRRWDPADRVWRVPLDPDRAETLSRLLESQPQEPQVSQALMRAIERRRRRRRRDECLVDRARPDDNWWLSFCTDTAPEVVTELLEHPAAYQVPDIGRALIPVDDNAARIVEAIQARTPRLRISDDARRALLAPDERPRRSEPSSGGDPLAHDVQLFGGRRGPRWILIGGDHAPVARALAAAGGLIARDGPAGSVALGARADDAVRIAALIAELDAHSIDPAVTAWLESATTWHGTVEVDGPREAPVFLLLGDAARLPADLRERARTTPGGASVPLTLDSWRLMDGRLRGWISHAAQRCAEAVAAGRPAPPAVLECSLAHGEPAFALAPGHDTAQLDAFAGLTGALSDGPLPAIRADPFHVPELDRFLAAHEPWVDPEALALLQEIREQHARAAGLVALSAATDGPLDLPDLGGELKPFQRAGVSYLLAQRRAFLADEQGLGKTIEALATLEADGAYPAIVLCPASLKLNWLRELQRWLPARSVRALSGTRGAAAAGADITVANYDIVAARLAELSELAPRALVLDESHYCKNPGAKRTQAVQRLAASVPRDGLVLALTGTPVMNRPAELISQLRILGRLGDFGSGAQFGQRFRGPDAHLRLHWHLRARCFVRRLKSEVLPQLPAKTRCIVPVELDNEVEYRLAERDVIAWLKSQPLDLRELEARVAAALRAERLVRLNKLKLLAARGKLHAALAWIHDFCSSGERLVVFARHREVQHALLQRFPAALHVLGDDSHAARDASVRAFQGADAEQAQLIVCSMEVAGQGITLTQASNVAFLELDWTPAKHDQAEDRCHRIGQHDAVTAWYLLAAATIDETIASLLERKRAVIGAVTDGREEDEAGVVDALVRELRGEPYRHLRSAA